MNMPLGCGLPNQRAAGQGREVDAGKHTVDTFFPVERWGQDIFCLLENKGKACWVLSDGTEWLAFS